MPHISDGPLHTPLFSHSRDHSHPSSNPPTNLASILLPRITDVLIVGAGPTGLSLALFLVQHGVRILIVDQAPTHTTRNRPLILHSRSLEAFKEVGVFDKLIEEGNTVQEIDVSMHPTRADKPIQTNYAYTHTTDDMYTQYTIALEKYKFERIIIRKLSECGVKVFWMLKMLKCNKDVKETTNEGIHMTHNRFGYAQFPDYTPNVHQMNFEEEETPDDYYSTHPYTVVLKRMTAEMVETQETYAVRTKYIIGCDGANSSVRRSNNIDFEGIAFMANYFIGDVEIRGHPDIDFMKLNGSISSNRFILCIPMEPNVARVITTAPEQLAASTHQEGFEDKPISVEVFAAHVKGVAPQLQIDKLHWCCAYNASVGIATTFNKDGIFLCGDAAHVIRPVGEQGINLAIQDANNLSWKLAAVTKGGAHPSLLDSYSRERQSASRNARRWVTSFWKILLDGSGKPSFISSFLPYRTFLRLAAKAWLSKTASRTISILHARYAADNKIIFESQLKFQHLEAGRHFPYFSVPTLQINDKGMIELGSFISFQNTSKYKHHLLLFFVTLKRTANNELQWDRQSYQRMDETAGGVCSTFYGGDFDRVGAVKVVWVITYAVECSTSKETTAVIEELPTDLIKLLLLGGTKPYSYVAFDYNREMLRSLGVESTKGKKRHGASYLFVLLRPDGYVSLIGNTVDNSTQKLMKYVTSHFS